MHMIDPEDILKQVAAIKERAKPKMGGVDQDACNARLEHDISSHLFAWRAGESNRQTDPEQITEALVSLSTSHLAAHMFECVEPDHYVSFAMGVANDLLRNLIMLADSAPGERKEFTQVIHSKEMGVA